MPAPTHTERDGGQRPSPIRRLRSEEGVALPVAVGVLMIILVLTAAVFEQGVVSSGAATEDRRVKRAVQAADAGVDVALHRMGKVIPPAGEDPCPVVDPLSGGGTDFEEYVSDGGQWWCPAVSEDLGGGASYTYRVSALAGGEQWIVSTGTVDGLARRVKVRKSTEVTPLFGDYSVFSDGTLELDSNAQITGTGGSNGDVRLGSNSRICGPARPGPGRSVIPATPNNGCSSGSHLSTPAPSVRAFPPVVVNPSPDGNARLKCVLDTCTSSGDISWTSASKRLKIDSDSTLTIGGSAYVFCQLEVNSNGRLIVPTKPAGQFVDIYIDAPSRCRGSSRLLLDSNAKIVNQGGNPATVRIWVAADVNGNAGSVEMNSNATATAMIYAPKSDVRLDSNARLTGAIIGETVRLNSNSGVTYDQRVQDVLGGVGVATSDYRECAPSAGTGPPGARC